MFYQYTHNILCLIYIYIFFLFKELMLSAIRQFPLPWYHPSLLLPRRASLHWQMTKVHVFKHCLCRTPPSLKGFREQSECEQIPTVNPAIYNI